MTGITVTLSPFDQSLAGYVGLHRAYRARWNGRKHAHGLTVEGSVYDNDIIGAMGEMAAAKALGRYWPASTEPDRDGDIGPLHVRATAHPRGHLLLHPTDKDAPFVLVRGAGPCFDVAGWVHAGDVKQQTYWREGDPGRWSFWVPDSELHPLEPLMAPEVEL